MANRQELKEQWQQRLQAWREPGMNQKQWCEQNHVRQPQFWYWKKKLEEVPAAKPVAHATPPALVPVALAPESAQEPDETATLAITLPNGLKISGIDRSNLSLASTLTGLLT